MKKVLFLFALLGAMLVVAPTAFAQNDDEAATEMSDSAKEAQAAAEKAKAEAEAAANKATEEVDEDAGSFGLQTIKQKFIEGGAFFMSFVLLCLILGLAFAIERIISLNLASSNPSKLLNGINSSLAEGDVNRAKELAKSSRGPVASIFYQGLIRADEGIENVEKAIVSYGSVQMGKLEKNLIWISLFIALAPMLGFLGTVIGMIDAFDNIEQAGTIEPVGVAKGIKIALITTVSGLIVAIILQVFYNYLISKIDSIVNTMEDASITFVDLLLKHNVVNK